MRVPPHEHSAYISDLLRHLERVGFDGAPRWLGRTDDGHELLTYIDGTVPAQSLPRRRPPYNLDDEQLVAASNLVLRIHDAVAGTPLCRGEETSATVTWGRTTRSSATAGQSRSSTGTTTLGPGSRAVDFADAVWGFADVTSESVPVVELARRVAVMCATYPAMSPGIVVGELRAQFERARSNHLAAARSVPLEVFDGLIAWIDRHGPTIAAAR